MPFYVYIIYSSILDRHYIGHSKNIEDRIHRHTNSGSKATKTVNDWKLVHSEQFESRSAAMMREKEIKRKKSRKYIEQLFRSG